MHQLGNSLYLTLICFCNWQLYLVRVKSYLNEMFLLKYFDNWMMNYTLINIDLKISSTGQLLLLKVISMYTPLFVTAPEASTVRVVHVIFPLQSPN